MQRWCKNRKNHRNDKLVRCPVPGHCLSAKAGKLDRSVRKKNLTCKEPLMKWIKKYLKIWVSILVLSAGLIIAGCEGTDSREMVDDTVRELSGQKNLERMKQMKKNIADINKKQADRLKNLP
jgi:hypothetical protein